MYTFILYRNPEDTTPLPYLGIIYVEEPYMPKIYPLKINLHACQVFGVILPIMSFSGQNSPDFAFYMPVT